MLARRDRLTPRSHVRRTIRSGRKTRSGSLVVHFQAGGDRPRAAVVVAKGFGTAVERHRRQRQVRHVLRQSWDKLSPGEYVVRALPGGDQSPGATARDLNRAVGRL